MLHPRFKNDKRATLKLNNLQIANRDEVNKKVENSLYQFEKVNCAVCDTSVFESLAEKDRYGLQMSIVMCKDCGLVQTNPRMTQESYNEFYNTEYRPLYVGTDKPTSHFFQRQYEKGKSIYNFLNQNGCLNFENDKPFVLEIGCGAGGILQYFKERGFDVKGIDLGASYIKYGIEKGLDLETGFLKDLKIDRQPDLVIYSHVVEHLLDPNEEMSLVASLISPSSCLYIEVPGLRNLERPYKYDFLRYLQNAHTYHFTAISLSNLLKKNGFTEVISTEFVRSIFRKKLNKESISIENDFEKTKKYLSDLEDERKKLPFYPYTRDSYWIKQDLKNIVLTFLNKTGLRNHLRSFLGKPKIG